MKIKRLHAHFLVNGGSYNNERIGFSVELEPGESIESVVVNLREKAIKLIGSSAQTYYDNARQYQRECVQLERKLNDLRKEWVSLMLDTNRNTKESAHCRYEYLRTSSLILSNECPLSAPKKRYSRIFKSTRLKSRSTINASVS